MHKLNRPSEEPEVLASARENNLDWDHFETSHKDVVRDALLIMQNFYCAYCERKIHKFEDIPLPDGSTREMYNGHIEHFRRKNQNFYPELMFDWNNLFFSCMTNSTCGKYKDHFIKSREQNDLLIDPCVDNPEDFFIFTSLGTIEIRSELNAPERNRDKQRALFTIKAFNLNDPNLVKLRKETIDGYSWLKNLPKKDLDENLQNMHQNIPFITAIFHYFGKRVVA